MKKFCIHIKKIHEEFQRWMSGEKSSNQNGKDKEINRREKVSKYNYKWKENLIFYFLFPYCEISCFANWNECLPKMKFFLLITFFIR